MVRTCPQGYVYTAAKCLTTEFIEFKLSSLGNNHRIVVTLQTSGHVNLKNIYVEIALSYSVKTSVQLPDILLLTLALVNIDWMGLQVLYQTLWWK